ncbi:MAG: M20/M25/M40 family metallo-hydrolase [Solirubrobacterales bacterium]|nr:M20/M25/M40 family metallo-hydrolase [Solirubrobacterales bacterium]
MTEGELAGETVALAEALIRVDTSNPPGRETAAAELIRDWLAARGIESELVGPDPDRLNLVSRIEGTGDAPSLMLMAHTDVVPAPTENWTVPPFDAVNRDGWLIGRGAVDMKNELAARVAAFAAFAASGVTPGGDLVLIAEADEERNVSDVGMSWLVRERPDLLCDFALNEGGGFLLELASGSTVVPISIGEKKVTSVLLRIRGASAHASVPDREKNAVRDAARAVDRLFAHETPVLVSESVRESLRAIGAAGSDEEMLAWAAGQHPVLEKMVPAMTRMSVTPTGLATREPANVVPPVVEIVCDCRALPGQDERDVRAHLEAALGNDIEWEMELLEPMEGGEESAVGTALYRACEDFLAERLPGAVLMPMVTAGFTDSHWVRQAGGTVAYGFAPVFATEVGEYLRSMHGADEKIRIDDLVTMAEFHLYAIKRMLAD